MNTPLTLKVVLHSCTGFLIFVLAGCGSVGPTTIELSSQTTLRTKDLRSTHSKIINDYFDFQETQVDRFIDEEWKPLFLRNFLGASGILNELSEEYAFSEDLKGQVEEAVKLYLDDESEAPRLAARISIELGSARVQEPEIINGILNDFVEDDKVEQASTLIVAIIGSETPALLILDFAQEANRKIEEQRKSMQAPLKQLRKELLDSTNATYDEILAGQAAIHGRLLAQAKLQSSIRDLGTIFVPKETISSVEGKLGEVGSSISNAIDCVRSLTDTVGNAQSISAAFVRMLETGGDDESICSSGG